MNSRRIFHVLFVWSLVVVGPLAQAMKPLPSPSPSAKGRAVDISHLMKRPEPAEEPDPFFKVSGSCEHSGQVFKKGDPGYDACMLEAAQKTKDQLEESKKEGAQR